MKGKYEIGFVQFFDGAAKEIVGPFPDCSSAFKECNKRNEVLNVTLPGRGKWGWMVAYWKEMPRTPDCT